MIKKRKKLEEIEIPEFQQSIDTMPEDSKIFVEKSLEIVNYIYEVMELKEMKQKDLAAKMGKTEAELSKILSGMHNLTLRSISKLEAALEMPVISIPKVETLSFETQALLGSHLRKLLYEQYSYETVVMEEDVPKEKEYVSKVIDLKCFNHEETILKYDKIKKNNAEEFAEAV